MPKPEGEVVGIGTTQDILNEKGEVVMKGGTPILISSWPDPPKR